MKLITDEKVNLYDAQNLCLTFFPGAKFPEDEEDSPTIPRVEFSVSEDGDTLTATARISLGDKTSVGVGSHTLSHGESYRKACRLACGAAMFEAGSSFFDFKPPWGMMTGVRPAKVAATMLREEGGADAAISRLRREYMLAPEKAELAVEVAQNEERLIASLPPASCSVYVSIPFCPSRCSYCSFVSYSTERLLSLIPEYLTRLISDIKATFSLIRELGMSVSTVYIGGGTPTVLSPAELSTLLCAINEQLPNKPYEFTVEGGRPDTITKEKLDIMHSLAVDRISINPQTLNDSVLKRIGRSHTARDFFSAWELARSSGIPSVNTDIIAGLPGDDLDSFKHTVDEILRLSPDNLTCHTFCVKRAADILHSDENIYSLGGGDVPLCVDYVRQRATESGYFPYYMYRQKNAKGNLENVGFSLPEKEGIYNVLIMEEVHSIFAVGAGASTKLVAGKGRDIKRIFTPKYPYEYLKTEQDETVCTEQIKNFFKEHGIV